jgi:hypothetical protein
VAAGFESMAVYSKVFSWCVRYVDRQYTAAYIVLRSEMPSMNRKEDGRVEKEKHHGGIGTGWRDRADARQLRHLFAVGKRTGQKPWERRFAACARWLGFFPSREWP